MLKSKLDKFIIKRAAVFLALMAAADMVFMGSGRWFVLAGLLAGAALSIGRLVGNEWILAKVFSLSGGKAIAGSIAAFTISQLVLAPVIILTYFLSIWALYGLLAGVLAVPAVIMLNSITEAFGITKNSFE